MHIFLIEIKPVSLSEHLQNRFFILKFKIKSKFEISFQFFKKLRMKSCKFFALKSGLTKNDLNLRGVNRRREILCQYSITLPANFARNLENHIPYRTYNSKLA